MCQACPYPLQGTQELPLWPLGEGRWSFSESFLSLFLFPIVTADCSAPLSCFSSSVFEQKLLQKEATPYKAD